jgi:predicted nucleic acid-binding protein
VTLVIDAAPLVAVADRRDPMGPRVESLLRGETGELVIPAPVTSEVDYLLGRRLGRAARLSFLDDLAAGRFTVACLDEDDYRIVLDLECRYDDLDVGLADLSAVVVASRYRTRRLLTFDERHFRALRPMNGGRFTLLPVDTPAR